MQGNFFAILASFCLANIPEYSGLGFVAAFSVVLNYFFDLIDGHHARTTNQCTNSGEFLDTTLDNLTYCFLFMGLAVAANMWFLGMLITYCFFITAMAGKYRRDLFRKTTIGYFGPAEIRTIFIMISLIMVYEPSVVFYLVPLFTIITMLGSLRQIFKISKEIDLTNLIVHTDQGFQFTSDEFLQYCKSKKIINSYSRRGNSLDNAPIESWFGLFKFEADYERFEYMPDSEVIACVEKYIEFYNTKRISIKLKGMTPYEYGNHSL